MEQPKIQFREERHGFTAQDPVYDPVNRPKHYTQYRTEVIDIVEDVCKSIQNGFHGWLVGNIVKYVLRFQFKNGVEDLKKARFYLDKLINEMEDGKNV